MGISFTSNWLEGMLVVVSCERRFVARSDYLLSERFCRTLGNLAYQLGDFGIQFAVFGVDVWFKTWLQVNGPKQQQVAV